MKLVAPDAAENDYFGDAVDISGVYLVAGSPGDDDAGSAAGAIYIYKTIDAGVTWDFVQKNVAPNAAERFGDIVAIEGDIIAVGAQGDSIDAGSVYIYTISNGGTTWDFMHKIVAPEPDAFDTFGEAVTISSNFVVIGAEGDDERASDAGAAYIYTTGDSGATWDPVQKLTASDAAENDRFGHSVAMFGDHIVVSAIRDDDVATDSGAVYIYRTAQGAQRWVQQRKLVAADAAPDTFFGRSVAIEGNIVVVGTQLSAVYVFAQREGRWTQTQKIVPRDLTTSLLSAAISGKSMVIGAFSDDHGSYNAGSIYVYETTTGGETWDFVQKLGAPDASQDDRFGFAVAIDKELLIVGAHGNDDSGIWSGSAYTYQLRTCAYMTMADSAGDGACPTLKDPNPQICWSRKPP